MIRGLHTALITPFSESGLDLSGFERNLIEQQEAGTDGLLLAGTTGESPSLSEKEVDLLFRTALKVTGGKVPLMLGTGTYSTPGTLTKTKRAQDLGASSALVITPYYNCPTQEGIYRHFMHVAEHTDIPILIYNHAGRTGRNIEVPTLIRLLEHPRIIGVKETSSDPRHLQELLYFFHTHGREKTLLSGDDLTAFSLLASGASGLISVASNLIPSRMKHFIDLLFNDRICEARNEHFELLPLFTALSLETNPIPIKTAMNLYGKAAGSLRLPLTEMSVENISRFKKLLQPAESLYGLSEQKSRKTTVELSFSGNPA